MKLNFLKGCIRILRKVSGCQRNAFRYASNKTRIAGMEGIRIPNEGIQMLLTVSRYQMKASGYTGNETSECWKEASKYVEGHPDT